jgi:hypothetical protein
LSRSTCARDEGKKKNNKKVTKAYISRMCRETPSGGIPTKFGTFGDLTDYNQSFQNFMLIGEGV